MQTAPARRLEGGPLDLEQPGDYCLGTVLEADTTRRRVWFLLPTADPADPWARARDAAGRHNGVHGVGEPIWTITEHDDGSVEVEPSIACGRHDPEGEYWHGYLRAHNVWEWD